MAQASSDVVIPPSIKKLLTIRPTKMQKADASYLERGRERIVFIIYLYIYLIFLFLQKFFLFLFF